MSLDTSTLHLVATIIASMLGAMLLFLGRQQKIAALTWWGAAYVLGAGSVATWMTAADAIGTAGVAALHALGFVACGLMWNAARVFHGRAPNWTGLFAGAFAWLALGAVVPQDSSLRLVIGIGLLATYAALTATELWSERRRTLQRRWPAIIVPMLHGFVLMLPVLIGDVLMRSDLPFSKTIWATALAVELVLYVVGTVFVIFMLESERTVRAHKAAAAIDPLTGLLNRRGFTEATARMMTREDKLGHLVTVMVFDIDHFKSINDRFGHPAGDEILKLFASVLSHSLRVTDVCGRIGGEEFAALLPCAVGESLIAAERVRDAFATAGIAVDDAPVDTSVSIGVAGGPADTDLEVLLAAADCALYQAKRNGRNRIETAAGDVVPTELDGRREAASQRKPNVVRRAGKLTQIAT